ncbi:MAG: LysR family transcriptional regulator [Gammaproteobacteria bacterium]|nr:LysR family transcriptional regulator [Gammaproteobacteria bacterium]
MLDPELLRTFVSVAETRGFTSAARSLHRTQSAVSLQIKRLEDRVGEPLFRRTSRQVTPTRAAEALLPYARRILHLHDEAAAAVGAVGRGRSLRLGITEEQALAYLPNIIPRFNTRFPGVQLNVQCDLSTGLLARMEDGELDLALVIRHGPAGAGEVLGRERLVWVAHQSFRNDPGEALPLAVNPGGCIYRSHALTALAGIRRPWRVAYVSASPTGINLALEANLAVSIKAGRSVPEYCRVLDSEAGIPVLPQVDVELHRSPTALSEVTDGFVELLMEEIEAADDVAVLPRRRS